MKKFSQKSMIRNYYWPQKLKPKVYEEKICSPQLVKRERNISLAAEKEN